MWKLAASGADGWRWFWGAGGCREEAVGCWGGGGFSQQQAWPWVAPAPCSAGPDPASPPTDLERVIHVTGNVGRCKIIVIIIIIIIVIVECIDYDGA